MKKLCLWMVLLTIFGNSAFAAFEWINTTSGYWNVAENWNPAQVPDTSDEIKIRQGGETIINSVETVYRVRLYNGTLTIQNGADLTVDWSRFGYSSGQTATVDQSGGTFDHTNGRLTLGSEGGTGIWNLSGGELLSSASGFYLGYSRSKTGPSIGRLVMIGTNPSAVIDELIVGGGGDSDTTGIGDTGILEFQVEADGVSPIEVTERLTLDNKDTTTNAYLEVNTTETTLPTEDILLVHVSSSIALAGTGVFDEMNGGSAAEGTILIMGGNLYSLTYQYDADADASNNDIALVCLAGLDDLANTPNPGDGDRVETSLMTLDWINPEPNDVGGIITCDVYLGTEPNRLGDMQMIPLGAGISEVPVSSFTSFPLQNQQTYYWVVDCHDTSSDVDVPGLMWSFDVNNNEAPSAYAGEDQITWGLPKVIDLNGETSDDGLPTAPHDIKWTQASGPSVAISPDNQDDTSVTITEAGVYEFVLTADDGDLDTSDSVQIVVGATACEASHLSTGDPYDAGDQNQDCLVNLEDFAVLIVANWLDCTDELTNCAP